MSLADPLPSTLTRLYSPAVTKRSSIPLRRVLACLAVVPFAVGWLTGPATAVQGLGSAAVTAGLAAKGKVCPEQRSRNIEILVQNLLATPVTLHAANVNCNEWSSTGNPTNINGVRLDSTAGGPGDQGYVWSLERNASRAPTWTLSIDGGDSGTGLGNVTLTLAKAMGYSPPRMLKVVGGNQTRVGDATCFTRRLNFTKAKKTEDLPPPGKALRVQIYSDGTRIVVRACEVLSVYVGD